MEDVMRSRPFTRVATTGLAIFSAVTLLANAAWASTTKVAYSFMGDEDGEYSSTDLVLDGAGNLYGTTVQGGQYSSGTVFELTRSGNTWTHTVLYSFTSGADGGQPYGGVTLDADGNVYGTAVIGGTGTGAPCVEDGCGVVYKLNYSGGRWKEHVIHSFTGGKDGYGPGAGVTFGKDGNIYGMTPTGGADGFGIIYQLRPARGNNWKLHVIHSFTGGKDGASPPGGRLILDDAGNLYGVATVGGAHGAGLAFELTQPEVGKWKLTPLYAFGGQPDAGFPYGALVFDKSGHLYGTTYYAGANNQGAVYRLAFRNGKWHETVLHSFTGGADGSGPISNLVLDPAGNLYGTTSEGGGQGCGCGTIFKLARGQDGQWTESIAHAFAGSPDGGFPYNGMVGDGAGHYYGATVHGGHDDEGAVYRFTP
jgi:uncharacterized repeat protein (TIGR03803 family)